MNPAKGTDLLKLARANDPVALETMFRQFVRGNEELIYARFLGRQGVFGFGPQCFAAVTDRRVATIQYSRFGGVVYQDGFLNKITSSVVYQPGQLWLIVMQISIVVMAIPTLGLALLLAPAMSKLFYAVHKSGVAFIIGDGLPVFLFCDRKLIRYANELQRYVMDLAAHEGGNRRVSDPPGQIATARSWETDDSRGSVSQLPLRSKRVRVTDKGLTRWFFSLSVCGWISAILAIVCLFVAGELLNAEAYSAADVVGVTCYLLLITSAVTFVSGYITLVCSIIRRSSRLPLRFRAIDSGNAVKLLSIPLVNLISPFFILPKLADCWDAAADESIEGTAPPSAYGLAVTICIFRLIPIVNLAVIPFLFPIYLRRIDNVQAGISACQIAQGAGEGFH